MSLHHTNRCRPPDYSLGMSRVEHLAPGLLFKLTGLQLIGNHRSPCWSLPSGLSAVRAGPPDCPAPFDAVPGGDLLLAVEAVRPVLVVLVQVLRNQFQAVGASGHQGRVVRVDRGHALGPAEWMFARGVVDYGIVFVRHAITLRSLVHQGRRLKAFRGVVAPAPWVAEGELCVLGEGVQDRRCPCPRGPDTAGPLPTGPFDRNALPALPFLAIS